MNTLNTKWQHLSLFAQLVIYFAGFAVLTVLLALIRVAVRGAEFWPAVWTDAIPYAALTVIVLFLAQLARKALHRQDAKDRADFERRLAQHKD
ncbi:MAG: hypothetical protein Q3962_04335 [Corynebacterium sp.]|nr:hypothetical protein [Corynebacterium sp.]